MKKSNAITSIFHCLPLLAVRVSKPIRVLVICSLLVAIKLVLAPTGLMAQAAAPRAQKPTPPSGWADTVFVNGKIATANDAQKFVEALAVRGDRIVAVGGKQQVEGLAGPETKVMDLKGKTVIPGLFGTHEHPHLWSTHFHDTAAKISPQAEYISVIGKTPEEANTNIQRAVQQAIQQRKPGEWIIIRTNEMGGRAMGERTPLFDPGEAGILTTVVLDKLAPNNPVAVLSVMIDFSYGKTGKVLTGSEAMKRAYQGYGIPIRSVVGPSILNSKAKEIHKAHGLEPAYYLGVIDMWFVPEAIGLEAYAEAIRREMQYWVETQGVTTFISTWFRHPPVLSAFSILARQKKMPARMAWYTWVDHPFFGSQEGVGDPYLWNVGVEHEPVTLEENLAAQRDPSLWGTPIAEAATYASNLPLVDPRLEKIKADNLSLSLRALPGSPEREKILKWLKQGTRVGDVHCYSDGAIDMFFSILRQLQKETGWSDEKIRGMRNFYLTHSTLVRPDQISELKKWGMVVGPTWRTMPDLPRIKIAYGEDVKKYVWPVKSLADAGVMVAPNFDMSPTFGPDGENTWDILKFLIDREYAGEVWNIAEAVDRWMALKMFTINGAWVALRENELGSLEVGKYADLVVLDKDYFTIPVKEISTVASLLTMVGGKIVFQKETF